MLNSFNTKEILGMNARNRLYTSKNSKQARAICHSKFLTKQLMLERGIKAAQILGILKNHDEVDDYTWSQLQENFVVKPSNGSGGKGIVVFTKKNEAREFIDTMGEYWSLEEIKTHCLDILEGKYSSHPGAETTVIIEERVQVHPQFLKLVYKGTPDLRIIVYNGVPVMAMLRLPTKESEGRANLHQGAIGVGIDLGTGITTHAITSGGKRIIYVPNSKKKLSGFLIPFWDEALKTAVQAANAAGLTYGGVDLFIDQNKGPLVVELNTSPGLSIQLANQQGLKRRLERIRGLQVLNSDHGIRIAKALFRSSLAEKFIPPQERVEITFVNQGEIVINKKEKRPVNIFVNTKRFRSCISHALALELELCKPEDLLWYQKTDTGEKAPVIEVVFILNNKKIKTEMLVSKQLDKSKNKIHLGRRDLREFVVKG